MKSWKVLLAAAAAVAAIATPAALAAGQAAPKATGDIAFNVGQNGSMQFNAIETGQTCTASWNVAGAWNFTFDGGATYEATLTQTGTTVGVDAGYPTSGPPYAYTLTTGSGSVADAIINLTMNYASGTDPTAAGSVMTMTGTIAANGTITGTWHDTYPSGGGNRSGNWASTSGAATQVVTGCSAKGNAYLAYADGSWYNVDVRYANVSGADAWFAGIVTASSPTIGHVGGWVTFSVHDGGEPAYLVDQVWGSWAASELAAKWDVAQKITPVDGPFAILGGNLQVH